MMKSIEEELVAHAAATLTGHKPGSLFSHYPGCLKTFRASIACLQWALKSKGVRICTFARKGRARQIFVYRCALIEKILAQPEVRSYLRNLGYPLHQGQQAVIAHLCCRICRCEHFPHELGVFLGYPLADVIGFIENQGKKYQLCGCWKVYTQPDRAKQIFDLYRNCRESCLARYHAGETVLQLTRAV